MFECDTLVGAIYMLALCVLVLFVCMLSIVISLGIIRDKIQNLELWARRLENEAKNDRKIRNS